MKQGLLLGALLASIASPGLGADLPRKGVLGIRMSAAPDGGIRVDEVLPGLTGAAMGLQPGDILTAAGSRPFAAVGDVVAYARTLTSGDRATLQLRRGGAVRRVSARVVPKPLESYAGATVDYGAVQFGGGQLRDVLALPANTPNPPVVYLIQGYSCGGVEGLPADHPYRRLGEELLKRGVGYYRVEKVGMGDSQGPLVCEDIDHDTELAGFRAAYDHLIDTREIAPERIFIFGHSLGGMQAPVVAAARPPRGIAAYGTVLRNWADYHHELDVFQGFMLRGEDPAASFPQSERNREVMRQFYFEKKAPSDIAAAGAALADTLRNSFAWDGGTRVFGRHYKFNQELAHLNVIPAWKNARTNVLSLYGESDIVALYDIDHKLLADMANQWRPGSGRYVEIAGTDHGMTLVGNRQEIRAKTRASGQPPEGPFNPAVADAVASWIRESLAKPPVGASG